MIQSYIIEAAGRDILKMIEDKNNDFVFVGSLPQPVSNSGGKTPKKQISIKSKFSSNEAQLDKICEALNVYLKKNPYLILNRPTSKQSLTDSSHLPRNFPANSSIFYPLSQKMVLDFQM